MRGLKRKTAIILASAVVTTSILAGGTLTALQRDRTAQVFRANFPPWGSLSRVPVGRAEHRRPKPHLLIPVRC